jgi:hypothetical protein
LERMPYENSRAEDPWMRDPDLYATRDVRRDTILGAASKYTYDILWILNGRKPGEFIVDFKRLANELGISVRAVDKQRDQLIKHGLLEIVEPLRKGWVRIYLYSPYPGERFRTPDPQKQLPFPELPLPKIPDLSAPKGPQESLSPDFSAPKGPQQGPDSDFSAPKGPPAHNISTHARADRHEDEDELIVVIKSLAWKDIAMLCLETWKSVYTYSPLMRERLPESYCWKWIIMACMLSKALEDGAEWLQESVQALVKKGKTDKDPIYYFRTCLRNKLFECLDRANNEQDAKVEFEWLSNLVRPQLKIFRQESVDWLNKNFKLLVKPETSFNEQIEEGRRRALENPLHPGELKDAFQKSLAPKKATEQKECLN